MTNTQMIYVELSDESVVVDERGPVTGTTPAV